MINFEQRKKRTSGTIQCSSTKQNRAFIDNRDSKATLKHNEGDNLVLQRQLKYGEQILPYYEASKLFSFPLDIVRMAEMQERLANVIKNSMVFEFKQVKEYIRTGRRNKLIDKFIEVPVKTPLIDEEIKETVSELFEVIDGKKVLNDTVTLIDEENIVICIDQHQNKHQKNNIGKLGTWKSQKGTCFAAYKDLDWHRENTAQVMKKWVETLDFKANSKYFTNKKVDIDGIIYDGVAQSDGVYKVALYHCNPVKPE